MNRSEMLYFCPYEVATVAKMQYFLRYGTLFALVVLVCLRRGKVTLVQVSHSCTKQK